MSESTLQVKCPTCHRPVKWVAEQLFKPFCSERCKMIDLGEWAMEEKVIPGEALDQSAEDEDVFFQ